MKSVLAIFATLFVFASSTFAYRQIVMSPGYYDFGEVQVGAEKVKTIKITSTGQDVRLHSFTSNSRDVEVKNLSCPTSGSFKYDAVCEIELKFKPSKSSQTQQTKAEISIQYTDHEASDISKMFVSGRTQYFKKHP